ncbi:MAG TPA: ABC transporter substrate-binding protein, partial [Candidatus Polarisedimenticolaceae bacterium]|nr:ABC transporter substrate-binding protein [Candidatus Polarisedimenticolaceae bacterium]
GVILALATGLAATACSSDVKIGAVISESGAVEAYGKRVRKGMELAAEEINAGGGLASGGQLLLVFRDDATNPERGKQVTQELIDQEGIDLIVGAVSSRVTLAIAPICEKERVLLISPSSSSPDISQAGEYIYRNYPSDIREGTSMAKFAKDLALEQVAIVAMDDEFGRGLREVFTQQYEGRSRQVIGSFEFDGGAAEFDAIVTQVTALAPDGIYLVGYENEVSQLLTELRAAEVAAVIMTSSAVTPNLVQLAGAATDNVVFPQTTFDLDSDAPSVAAFVTAYRQKYDEDPDPYAAHGYDAVKVLAEAINSVEGSHPDDVRIGLNGIQDYDGAAGKTTFDKNGDVVRHPRIMIFRNGAAMPYDEFVEEGGSILPQG